MRLSMNLFAFAAGLNGYMAFVTEAQVAACIHAALCAFSMVGWWMCLKRLGEEDGA